MSITHLRSLESEAVYVLREVATQSDNPALLFSGGKDSTVLVHLAQKAFAPLRMHFPLLHIDTGRNFPEVIEFRDKLVERIGCELVVATVEQAIQDGIASEDSGEHLSRNRAQAPTLMRAIRDNNYDALIGGARRDEEKSRAKERVVSLRNSFGTWEPKRQRPELWSVLSFDRKHDEHFRVFPLSNWTENDIWAYIIQEEIQVASLYYSHTRSIIRDESDRFSRRQSPWLPNTSENWHGREHWTMRTERVRFRTVGDTNCSACIKSDADTGDKVLSENRTLNLSERGLRMDDRTSETAMEDRKQEGYF